MRRESPFTVLIVLIAGVVAALPAVGMRPSPVAATEPPEPPMKIEIVVKDNLYKVTGHTLPGAATTLVLRNQDSVRHGFASTLFRAVPVRIEVNGIDLVAGDVKVYHVRPGRSLTIHFRAPSPEEFETQSHIIWCDLHPDMKGEVFVLDTRGG